MGKTKLRKYASGKPCQVRLFEVCTHNEEETVLAHKNGAGHSIKHNDLIGAWACSACHAWLDGGYAYATVPVIQNTRRDRDEYHNEAIIRTQQELLKTANRHGVTLAEAIEQWALGLEL